MYQAPYMCLARELCNFQSGRMGISHHSGCHPPATLVQQIFSDQIEDGSCQERKEAGELLYDIAFAICLRVQLRPTVITSPTAHPFAQSMAPKHRDGDEKVAFSGKWVSWAHTICAYAAFVGAFIVGVYLHYHKIVENEYYVCILGPKMVGEELTRDSRAIRMSGFPLSRLRLETATLSGQSFNSSLP